ncbi:hypothetical protein QJQ45_010954 [Haematococcus lacustris]|nr:hypothetical protein QJQ45_010954 [Haematococcus lacustris]
MCFHGQNGSVKITEHLTSPLMKVRTQEGVEVKVERFSHRQPLLALRLVRTLAAATHRKLPRGGLGYCARGAVLQVLQQLHAGLAPGGEGGGIEGEVEKGKEGEKGGEGGEKGGGEEGKGKVDEHANFQRLFALTACSWHWQEVAAAGLT